MNRSQPFNPDSSYWLLPDVEPQSTKTQDFKKKTTKQVEYANADRYEEAYSLSFRRTGQSYANNNSQYQLNNSVQRHQRKDDSYYNPNEESLSYKPRRDIRYDEPDQREYTQHYWEPRREQPDKQGGTTLAQTKGHSETNSFRRHNRANKIESALTRQNESFHNGRPLHKVGFLSEASEFMKDDSPVSNFDVALSIKLNATRVVLMNRFALEQISERDFLMVPYTTTNRNLYPLQELKDFLPGELDGYIDTRLKQKTSSSIILKYPNKQMAGLVLINVTDNPTKALYGAFHELDNLLGTVKSKYVSYVGLVVPYMLEPTNQKSIDSYVDCILSFFRHHSSGIDQVSMCIHWDLLFFQCEAAFSQQMISLV